VKQRLVRIDPLAAARVVGLLYFLIGLLALPFVYFMFVLTPEGIGFSPTIVLLEPFLLSGVGYASTAVGCVLFNWLAGRLGGLEVELEAAD
jgi:hypothetical protein